MLEVAHFLFPGRASRRHALSESNALMRAAGWDFLTCAGRSPEGTIFSPISQLFCFTLFRTQSRNASTDMTTLCVNSPYRQPREGQAFGLYSGYSYTAPSVLTVAIIECSFTSQQAMCDCPRSGQAVYFCSMPDYASLKRLLPVIEHLFPFYFLFLVFLIYLLAILAVEYVKT